MSSNHIASNRNSTPEAASSLRPPHARAVIGAGHHLRASADMGGFSSPLVNRGVRPVSEIYFGRNNTNSGNPDEMERAAQQWLADIDQYENTLEEMATATLDQDFKDELAAIEQWFRVLCEAERTAALYALLQQTTQVQIRFFIQVLQQMSNSLPISGVLSPANFGEKDPMTQKLSDAMSKLTTGDRSSIAAGRPPPSPGAKRNSGLDQTTIQRMFPDAAAAIAKQKAEFTETVGMAPASNRNSTVGDRTSLAAPTISAPEETTVKDAPPSPWGEGRQLGQPPAGRPKSSGQQHPPMGQFVQPPPSAGLRSPRLPLSSEETGNVQSTTLNAPSQNPLNMPFLSPSYAPGGSWASQLSTPLVANFNNPAAANQADMVANATAMKLAALSTVNNRITLDDARKYRRARSTDGGAGNDPLSPGFAPTANGVMINGQLLTPQQAAALQQQQLAALQGRRSRPSSPGFAMQAPSLGAMSYMSPQNNGYLTADYGAAAGLMGNGFAGLSLSQFGIGLGGDGGHSGGYLSDHSEIPRGRSPRGRRGSSKPPEDPTDVTLLQDIPSWLRSLRLHKYTDHLKDLKWQELVELDDAGLERRGVNALGARRKMLKVFEQVKEAKEQGKIPR